jgi:hypothetical protein
MKTLPVYGTMAEFASAQDLVVAARRTHEAGYRKIDAYSPFPVEELADAIGFHKNNVALVALLGAITGGLTGYLMQYWMAVVSYPVNVGGRPLHSWPSFIIVTFEMTMPYHPVFNVPRFVFASKDRFFLMIFSTDPKYDARGTRQFLEGLQPRSISEVPS